MGALIKHWQIVGWLLAISGGLLYIHQRDARIRAEGEAKVYLQQADSMQQVADAFRTVADAADARADSVVREATNRILEAETIIGSIQENEPRAEAATDSTIALLRATISIEFGSLIDSLDVEIAEERLAHEREREQFIRIIDEQDAIIVSIGAALVAKDQQIEALNQTLAARIAAANATAQAKPGIVEKALYAIGGVAVGFTISQLGGF